MECIKDREKYGSIKDYNQISTESGPYQHGKRYCRKSSVSEGLCCVFVPHTTAGLVIYSGIDPKGLLDLNDTVKTMVPVRTDFHHQCDPPSDAAGHIKSALFGNSITFIVHENELVLGGSQYLYFYEFDGPRERQVLVQVTGTAEE